MPALWFDSRLYAIKCHAGLWVFSVVRRLTPQEAVTYHNLRVGFKVSYMWDIIGCLKDRSLFPSFYHPIVLIREDGEFQGSHCDLTGF